MIWQVHIVEAHWLLCGVVDWLWRLCLNGICTSLWVRVPCSCSRMLNSSLKGSTEFEFYNTLVLSLEPSFLFVNNYNCLLWLQQHRRVCCALSFVTANRCTAAWRMNYARWKGASDTAHFIMWIKEHYLNIRLFLDRERKITDSNQHIYCQRSRSGLYIFLMLQIWNFSPVMANFVCLMEFVTGTTGPDMRISCYHYQQQWLTVA